MLHGFIVLFTFNILGELLVTVSNSPVPGPVAGMLLLFATLCLRKKASDRLVQTSEKLLMYLPLLLIPAGVGVMQYRELLQQEALAIIVALILGTTLTMACIIFIARKTLKFSPKKAANDDH